MTGYDNHDDEVILQLDGVNKVFETDEVETHALLDIHLEIRRGDYVCISGPSGSGKTTLLSILGLLDSPSHGTYLLDREPVSNLTSSQRARYCALSTPTGWVTL